MATSQNFNANPDVLDNTVVNRFDTVENLDDGSEASDAFAPNMTEMVNALYDCMPSHYSRIEDFLSREVVLKQGTWSNEAKGTILWTGTFPKDLILVSQNAIKVRGFVGMKAKVRVQVKVNSTQFQAGCLGLYYIPYADYMTSHAKWISQTTGGVSENNLPCLTSCPGVELDLANNTSQSFLTPYVSPYIYVNLVTGQGSFGSVYLVVLSQVASSAASEVSYTVFASFEDVTLLCATDAPVSTNWAQSDTELRVREQTGTISGVVSTVGESVSNFLPKVGLGALSAPVAAATTVGTGLLRLFGMSKPTDQKPVTRVLQSPAHFFLNADGVDTSHKLGLSGANETQVLNGFAGTSEDEMNIDYMCRRRGYVDSFTWSDTDLPDQLLKKLIVTPRLLGKIAAYAADTKAYKDYPTIAGRVATMFNQWRGTIVYTFHFVKTQTHSGRIRLSFRPGSWGDESDLKDMIGYATTSVVDLSAGTTVSFRVPFVAARPWLYTAVDRLADLTQGDLKNCSTGSVTAVVLNPLRTASTVSSSVDVLVFAHMEDAEFGGPILPVSIPAGLPSNDAQMMAQTVPTNSKTEITGQGRGTKLLPGATCLGENVPSLRPLSKRYSFVGNLVCAHKAPTTTVRGTNGREINIFPWAPIAPPKTTGTTPDYVATDFYSHLYSMYAFVTGPIRYKVIFTSIPSGANVSNPIMLYINSSVEKSSFQEPVAEQSTLTGVAKGPLALNLNLKPTGETINTGYQPTFGNYAIPIYLDKEGAIEFEVPYYSTGHMVCTKYGLIDLTDRRSSICPVPVVTLVLPDSFVNSSNRSTTISVYRAVGDSLSFGGLLGSPGVLTYSYAGAPLNPTVIPANNAQMNIIKNKNLNKELLLQAGDVEQNPGPNPATGFHVQTQEFYLTASHPTMASNGIMDGLFQPGPTWFMVMVNVTESEWVKTTPVAFKVSDNSDFTLSTFDATVYATNTGNDGLYKWSGTQMTACFTVTVPSPFLLQFYYQGTPTLDGANARVTIWYSNSFFIPSPMIPFGVSNGGSLPVTANVGESVPVSIVSPTGSAGAVVVELDPDVPPPKVEIQEPLWVTQFNET